jgi:hypothetical protein
MTLIIKLKIREYLRQIYGMNNCRLDKRAVLVGDLERLAGNRLAF